MAAYRTRKNDFFPKMSTTGKTRSKRKLPQEDPQEPEVAGEAAPEAAGTRKRTRVSRAPRTQASSKGRHEKQQKEAQRMTTDLAASDVGAGLTASTFTAPSQEPATALLQGLGFVAGRELWRSPRLFSYPPRSLTLLPSDQGKGKEAQEQLDTKSRKEKRSGMNMMQLFPRRPMLLKVPQVNRPPRSEAWYTSVSCLFSVRFESLAILFLLR